MASFYSAESFNTEYTELLGVATAKELIIKFCPEPLAA